MSSPRLLTAASWGNASNNAAPSRAHFLLYTSPVFSNQTGRQSRISSPTKAASRFVVTGQDVIVITTAATAATAAATTSAAATVCGCCVESGVSGTVFGQRVVVGRPDWVLSQLPSSQQGAAAAAAHLQQQLVPPEASGAKLTQVGCVCVCWKGGGSWRRVHHTTGGVCVGRGAGF